MKNEKRIPCPACGSVNVYISECDQFRRCRRCKHAWRAGDDPKPAKGKP